MEEDQIDPGLITVTLSSSEFGGFPGLLPDLLPPDGFPFPDGGEMPDNDEEGDDDGEMPEDGEEDGDDGGVPADFPLPEGFPDLDALGMPEEVELPEPIEAELIIEGFVVTGSRDTTVMIKGEEMDEDMVPPMEGEAPMEPAEPVEEE